VIVPEIAHDDMPDFYRLADVVVSVPESDSASVTMLEALACGRPLVATDLPAVREWLGEFEGPELVPVDDPAATAAALRRALDQPPRFGPNEAPEADPSSSSGPIRPGRWPNGIALFRAARPHTGG